MDMRKLLFVVGTVLVAAVIFAGFASAQGTALKAIAVSTAPTVDGSGSDAAWTSAPELTLKNGAKIKAVYTADTISFLVKWDDPTMSMVRGGSWSWKEGKWVKSASVEEGAFNEDRFNFLWNINISDFATRGCATKCHGPQGDATGAWLEKVGEYGDMWHMKAARMLPAISASQSGDLVVDPNTHAVTAGTVILNGYYDDKIVAAKDDPKYPFSPEDGGRHGDAGKSAYTNNRNKDKTGPLYMESAPKDFIDAMTLHQSEVDNGEAVAVADLTADQISQYWAAYDNFHAVVPERILHAPEGSRGDIREAATWSNGVWTAECQRKLVTGNPDDVQFDDLTKSYLFATTIMDNSGGDNHDLRDTLETLQFVAAITGTLSMNRSHPMRP